MGRWRWITSAESERGEKKRDVGVLVPFRLFRTLMQEIPNERPSWAFGPDAEERVCQTCSREGVAICSGGSKRSSKNSEVVTATGAMVLFFALPIHPTLVTLVEGLIVTS